MIGKTSAKRPPFVRFLSGFGDRVAGFFTRPPVVRAAFQLTGDHLSGVALSHKDRSVQRHFLIPLDGGIFEPSLYKPNIKNRGMLERRIGEGLEELGLAKEPVAVLLPELAQKSFVFDFESFPASPQERERFLLFRIKKQVPVLPEDTRLSYDVIRNGSRIKVLAAIARGSVVAEYESLFTKNQVKVGAVGIPFLSLARVLQKAGEADYILVNVEKDSLSLVGAVGRDISLYRQKTMPGGQVPSVETIALELSNTARFLEDREQGRVTSIWARLGMTDPQEDWLDRLGTLTSIPVRGIEAAVAARLHHREKHLLSPLLGELL